VVAAPDVHAVLPLKTTARLQVILCLKSILKSDYKAKKSIQVFLCFADSKELLKVFAIKILPASYKSLPVYNMAQLKRFFWESLFNLI
jgi:hypothetical protein